jgi:hypothetical protein
MKVVISSGHGKHVAGASGPSPWGLVEVDEARRTVEQAASVMRLLGVDTTTYHDDISDDQDENLKRIVDFHNSKSRDLDVSVHFNSATFSGSNQTNNPVGCEVFYASTAGKEKAKPVVDAICAASGLINRGPKSGNLYFLNHTAKTAILIEVCFVNSHADADIYRAKFHDICTAIAEGISGQDAAPAPEPEPPSVTLEGKQLRYLIGGNDTATGADNEVTELSYDATRPPAHGIGVKYGNLFNEKYADQTPAQRARYAPYLEQGDTAEEYNEGQIDPAGQGWHRNLDEQITRAKQQGFTIIEWDNPDSYDMGDVMDAVEFAHNEGLQVLAKNPAICSGNKIDYIRHAGIVGVIVEKDCGTPDQMSRLRIDAGKPTLPVWFVAFGGGRAWADRMAKSITDNGYSNMGVTYSSQGEYRNSEDVLLPNADDGPVPIPPQPQPEEHATVGKGDTGSDVVVLQKTLGVLIADGDFGSITDTWVRAFQASCGLGVDGIVGPKTWAEVDALDARVKAGLPRLPKALADQIYTISQTSEIADYSWPDRGVPPPGYIAGMALSFAYAVTLWMNDNEAAGEMAHAEGDPEKDALAWYKSEFSKLGMKNNVSGLDTLRHLFVMQTGLGPRESSGKYCEGRDMSASNVQSDTCEAGLFQTSWNIRSSSSAIGPMLPEFWGNPNGFLSTFKEGISPTSNNLNSYGSGDGVRYQFLSRFCPLFHVMVTAVGMRKLRQHWGPIARREVTLKKEMDDLLIEVQKLVEGVA